MRFLQKLQDARNMNYKDELHLKALTEDPSMKLKAKFKQIRADNKRIA